MCAVCGHRRGPRWRPDHLGRSSKLEVVEHVDIDLDINVHGNHFGSPRRPLRRRSGEDDRRLHQEKQHPADDDHPRHTGAPTIDLPVPEGWTRIPEGADALYGGIVFNTPTNPDDPPKIIAIVEKLTGDVDTYKLLAVSSGEIKNLPGYKGSGGQLSTLSGYPASRLGGSYTKNGVTRMVAQNTVAIEREDGVYVLQLNAEGPEATPAR